MRKTNLPIDVLRSFVAIVETGSMTRAAEQICVTQSALSLQMARLAKITETQLFARNKTGVLLTPDGASLLVHARAILDLNDRAITSIKSGSTERPVRLGMVQDVAAPLLSGTLTEFMKLHPDISLSIKMPVDNSLQKQFDAGLFDIMLTLCEAEDSLAVHVAQMQWLGHADLLNQREIPLAVMDSPCPFREAAIDALERAGKDYRIILETPGLGVLRSAVQCGLAITCRPQNFFFSDATVVEFPAAPLKKIGYKLQCSKLASEVVCRLHDFIRCSIKTMK